MSESIEKLEARLQQAIDGNPYSSWMDSEEESIRKKLIRAYDKSVSAGDGRFYDLCRDQFLLWKNYYDCGRIDDSRKMFLEMEAIGRKYCRSCGPHFFTGYVSRRLKQIYRRQDSLLFNEDYSELLSQDYDSLARMNKACMRRVAGWYKESSVAFYVKKDYSKCEELLKKSVSLYARTYDDEYETPPEIMSSLLMLSDLYRLAGNAKKQLRSLRKALSYARMYAGWDCNFERYVKEFSDAIKALKKGK